MFGFFKRKAETLQHWIAFVQGFQLVPSEFYSSVEAELKARGVPGMEMSQIEFSEGGITSAKRIYLRMVRERLVFDVCAAPFGRSFFLSCRFAEIPAVVQLWQLLVLAVAVTMLGFVSLSLLSKLFGVLAFIIWPLAWIVVPLFAIYAMRNSAAMGLVDLDRTLMRTPILGAVYEAWIRKDTYYRQDTRLMYLETVSDVVKHLAEAAVASKGLKLLIQYEQTPIFGEIYKRVRTSPPDESSDMTRHEFSSRTDH
jgi:hypothetical protein